MGNGLSAKIYDIQVFAENERKPPQTIEINKTQIPKLLNHKIWGEKNK